MTTTKADSRIFVPYENQSNVEEVVGAFATPVYLMGMNTPLLPVEVKPTLQDFLFITSTPTSSFVRLSTIDAYLVIIENIGSGIIYVRKTGVNPAIQIGAGKSREFRVISNLDELDIRSDNGTTPVQIEVRS